MCVFQCFFLSAIFIGISEEEGHFSFIFLLIEESGNRFFSDVTVTLSADELMYYLLVL